MIKKTFKTLKSNPVIFLGFAVPMVIMVLTMLPMFFSMDSMMDMIYQSIKTGAEVNDLDILTSMGGYFLSVGLMIILGLIIGFIVIPPVLNKVYEVCSERIESGWIKRGLKRSWWKIVVTGFIIGAASSAVVFIAVILMLIPVIGALIYIAAIFTLSIFALIAYTAVIAEDDFGKGLNNTFYIGSKYFFKLLGTTALFSIPPIVLSIGLFASMIIKMLSAANTSNAELIMMETMSSWFSSFWIVMTIMYIYYIFSGAFLYTYSMHQYLNTKSLLESHAAPKDIPPAQDINSQNTNNPIEEK